VPVAVRASVDGGANSLRHWSGAASRSRAWMRPLLKRWASCSCWRPRCRSQAPSGCRPGMRSRPRHHQSSGRRMRLRRERYLQASPSDWTRGGSEVTLLARHRLPTGNRRGRASDANSITERYSASTHPRHKLAPPAAPSGGSPEDADDRQLVSAGLAAGGSHGTRRCFLSPSPAETANPPFSCGVNVSFAVVLSHPPLQAIVTWYPAARGMIEV